MIDVAYPTSQVQGNHLSVFDASFAGTCHGDENAQPEIAEGARCEVVVNRKNIHPRDRWCRR